MSLTELTVEEIVPNTDDIDASGNGYTIKELDSSHGHHERIIADFQEAGIKVLKIEKLWNSSSVEVYTSCKTNLLNHRGGNISKYESFLTCLISSWKQKNFFCSFLFINKPLNRGFHPCTTMYWAISAFSA